MNFILSYFSGLVAAFTPCVIVLMPILLYRFFHEKSKQWFDFSMFVLSFLISYVIFGYFLSSIFTSIIQEGLKIGLGLLFVILGILAIMRRLNPINFPLIKNIYLLGFVFAMIISFNPCTLPYLSLIISINSQFYLIFSLIFFAFGLITPSILFAIFGNKILVFSNKSGRVLDSVNKLMHLVLIFSGVYLMFGIKTIDVYDLYLISFFIIFIFYILIKSFFIIGSKKDFMKFGNILLIFSLFLILFTAFSHCEGNITSKASENKLIENLFVSSPNSTIVGGNNVKNNIYSCNGDISTCKVCRRCIYIFSFAVLIGFIGLFFIGRKK